MFILEVKTLKFGQKSNFCSRKHAVCDRYFVFKMLLIDSAYQIIPKIFFRFCFQLFQVKSYTKCNKCDEK